MERGDIDRWRGQLAPESEGVSRARELPFAPVLIWCAWTSVRSASSLSLESPLRVASATLALKAGL